MPLLFGKYRRYVILVVCIIEMLSMSGIIYGWNSLPPVWKKYEVYGSLCPETNGTAYAPSDRTIQADNQGNKSVQISVMKPVEKMNKCDKQNKMYSNAFIVGTSFQFIIAFPAGLFYDRFGIRITKITNGVFFFLACLTMGLVSSTRSFLIFPGSCLLAVGSALILLTNLQIGSLFPAWQYLIISLYSGGFDSSSIMMELIKVGFDGGISLLVSFLILGVVGILTMFFVGFFLFPKKSLLDGESTSNQEPSSAEEAKNLKADGEEQLKLEVSEEQQQQPQEAEAAPRSDSLSSCICSVAFISQVIWFSCILLRFSFFMTDFYRHLNYRFSSPSDEKVRVRLRTALSLFLFMGILVAPLSGFITDCFKKRFAKGGDITRGVVLRALSLSQALAAFFAFVLSLLMFVPGEATFYACYVAEVFTRAFLFSLNSAYFLTVFPPQFFGQLFGVCFFIGGIVTQFQYALLKLGFIWSNVVVLVLTLISFVHPIRLSGVFKRCCP